MQIPAPQPTPVVSAADLAKTKALLESLIDLRKPPDKGPQSTYVLLDENGREIRKLDYLTVDGFSESLAAVFNFPSSGYVNSEGDLVIPRKFGNARAFSEGLAWIHSQDKGNGYIDHKGEQVIANHDFFDGLPFSEGLAAVRARVNATEVDDFRKSGENLPGKWGYINKSGAFVTAPFYDQAKAYHQQRAAVKLGDDWLFIDQRGAQMGDRYQQTGSFSDGLAPVKGKSRWGYVSREGQLDIPVQFEDAKDFSERLAAVKIGGKYGFIDCTGKIVIKPLFKNVDHFSAGLCAAQTDTDKWGYINSAGEFVIPPAFSQVLSFSDERAVVRVEHKAGIIDKTGKFVVQAKYDNIFPYSGNRTVVTEKNWNHPIMRMVLMEMHMAGLKVHQHSESPTGVYVPVDLPDALRELDAMLPAEAKADMKAIQKSEMSTYHLGFALWLRNNWGLWKQSRLATNLSSLGLHHPDDMSSTILDAYWCQLHEQPFDLAAAVARCDAWWGKGKAPVKVPAKN